MPRRNRREDEWLQPSRKPKGKKRPRGWHRSANSPGMDDAIRFLFGDTAGAPSTPTPSQEDTPFAA